MKGIKKLILILLVTLGGISCSDKPAELWSEQEEVMVRLIVAKPNPDTYKYMPGSKANDPETEISEIQLLVFEEGAYKYRVPGISITNTSTTTTFNARLIASNKPLDLYIIANATANVQENEPNTNDTENEIKEKLLMAFPANGSFPIIPMFGQYHLPSGLAPNHLEEIKGINMLRALARADVLVGTVPEFELTSIQAYRANSQIQLIPEQDLSPVTTPSIPASSQANVNTSLVSVTGNQSLAQLYLPESASPSQSAEISEATCIVIGGKYGNDAQVTYYRIDFDPDHAKNSFGQVLRNHRYIFTIKSVAGPGWFTPDEAANNRSAQINLEIKAWDEATADMYFDTEHHFGVSAREISLGSKQNATATIQVNTDLPDYTLQWSDAQGNVSGTAAESLINSFFKVEKTNSGDNLIITALQNNSDQTERTGYFVISASRWQILMTIRQRNTEVSGRAINFLSFSNSLGNLGVNLMYPRANADGRGTGARGILVNLNNFGPSGTVVCGGFNLLQTYGSTSYALSDALLASVDIVYFNYVAASALSNEDVQAVRRWLEGSPKRIAIITYDGSSINTPLLTEFLGSTSNIKWLSSNSGPYPLVGKTTTNYFTDTGPFTVSPYTPIPAGFSFQNYDAYHGEIEAGSAEGIFPILNGPSGGIVLGIDMSRRIIYMGDVDLFTSSNGTGYTTNNHINNTTGTINNDASKLIANLFAWVVGIITSE